MSLTIGTRLGPYEIVSAIGAGGMGEVYRARDTKLNRDVAIKVLPESFALDADRVAPFTREAQVLASLNHPNIAAIYGIEESGNTRALVMELVEGEDLSAVIARHGYPEADSASSRLRDSVSSSGRGGGAPRNQNKVGLSLDEALPIAKQIADALEAAHEQGIVHRDLKPANIKLRADGTAKVLDFGLAKIWTPDSGPGTLDQMNSPTMTARATQMGMIIGTAAYMSPEQARGRTVDRRADIWAFGVVLYEMLTGRRAFEGDDISITLASVLKEDVRWDALPADLPSSLRRLLQRCLEKDPKRRLSWIGEARLALDKPATSALDARGAVVALPLWRRPLPWAIASIVFASVFAISIFEARFGTNTAAAPVPRRLLAGIGADASLITGVGPSVILSPDGTTMAFVARLGGQPVLFVRKLDQLQATAIPETEGAFNTFFSPNGKWIAFFLLIAMGTLQTGSDLMMVPLTGNHTPVPYLNTSFNERSGRIAPDGHSVAYVSDESARNEVYVQSFPKPGNKVRVSVNGGANPQWSDDGKALYFVAVDPDGKPDLMRAEIRVGGPPPVKLFEIPAGPRDSTRPNYAVFDDGRRFLVSVFVPDTAPKVITIGQNWAAGFGKER